MPCFQGKSCFRLLLVSLWEVCSADAEANVFSKKSAFSSWTAGCIKLRFALENILKRPYIHNFGVFQCPYNTGPTYQKQISNMVCRVFGWSGQNLSMGGVHSISRWWPVQVSWVHSRLRNHTKEGSLEKLRFLMTGWEKTPLHLVWKIAGWKMDIHEWTCNSKKMTDHPLLCDFARGYYFGVMFVFLFGGSNHIFWKFQPRFTTMWEFRWFCPKKNWPSLKLVWNALQTVGSPGGRTQDASVTVAPPGNTWNMFKGHMDFPWPKPNVLLYAWILGEGLSHPNIKPCR